MDGQLEIRPLEWRIDQHSNILVFSKELRLLKWQQYLLKMDGEKVSLIQVAINT